MGKYAVRPVKTGIKFSLKAGNGEIIAVSEIYTTKSACLNGIDSIRRNAPIAALENQTAQDYEAAKNPKFEVYQDKAGEFRFRLKARNGEIIAACSEGYKRLDSCLNGIDSVRRNSDSPVVEEE
ncbi:MAG: YegP family protein [Oscillospiraceae bacterium]|nr:YegP family protein [Oscillospiraceae bacterium]